MDAAERPKCACRGALKGDITHGEASCWPERKGQAMTAAEAARVLEGMAGWPNFGCLDTERLALKAGAAALERGAANESTLAMTVARLGGMVGGAPTARHNFLQRIDKLRAMERLYEAAMDANERMQHEMEREAAMPTRGEVEEAVTEFGLAAAAHFNSDDKEAAQREEATYQRVLALFERAGVR